MQKATDLLLIGMCLLFATAASSQISFVNRSNTLFYQNVKSGAPMAVYDINGDGLDDIVRLDQSRDLVIDLQTPVLDPNFAGQSTNFTNGPYKFWSICLADYDQDGYTDIGLGEQNDYVILKGTSTPGAFTPTILSEVAFSQTSNFVDINNDGLLDLFVCDDVDIAKAYRQTSTGFVYDTSLIYPLSTVPSDNSGNYGSVWTDFDSDGDLDLYLSKCRLGVDDPLDGRRLNLLFENDGTQNFTDQAAASNLLPMAQTWSADFADIDNDGDFDAFLINHDQPNQLLINNGNGSFIDISNSSGILPPTTAAGEGIQCRFADFDNDGFVDLLYTSRGGGDAILRNNGNQTFTDQSASLPLPARIHSAATGDLNNDGFIDIITGHGNGYNISSNIADQLLINNANSNNYLKIKLEGLLSNKDAVGARLELYGSWGVQVREVRSGESYGIMHSLTQHFGLGGQTAADSLIIYWPSGTVDKIAFPIGNQTLFITEGDFCTDIIDFAFAYTDNTLELALTDISTVGSDSVYWTFGDGQSSNDSNPTHQYSTPGSYFVCLSVFGICDTAEVCKNIPLVCNEPESIFSFTKNGLEVSFSNFSENNPENFLWTFGDGNNSVAENPVHLYNDVGTYQVCLLSANDCGSQSTCNTVILGCENFASDFSFMANELTLAFNGSSENGLVSSWNWDFGNGEMGSGENTGYTYAIPGIYNVCLTTIGSCGTNTVCQNIDVSCSLPGIGFDTSSTDLAWTFMANSTAQLDSLYWTFGDGTVASGEDPSHAYTAPGSYEVCVEGFTLCGSIGFCNTIQVICSTPVSGFSTTASDLSITIGDDDIENVDSWFYDFGDGNSANSQSPSHTYFSPGTYQVCQTIDGICGSSQSCQSITVSCPPPIALYDALVNGLDVFFTEGSDNTAQAWLWNFGDNNISNQQNPNHSYDAPGTYEVCLSVSSLCGSNQYCQNITVSCAAPSVNISSTPNELSFTFTNQSGVAPSNYLWTFGDGNQSTSAQAQHTYALPGAYQVCLTVSNDCDQNTACIQVNASCPAPQAAFGFQTQILSIMLSNNTIGAFDSLYWTFGENGAGSELANPNYTYSQVGTYEICLTAYSICGSDQFCQDISFDCTIASADFSQIADELTHQFNYTGTGNPDLWNWDFGDATESDLENPLHTYAAPGTYQVCLTVTDACGSNQSCQTIEVNCTGASADFSFQTNLLSFDFTAFGPSQNTQYFWTFGDGTESTLMNPTHSYLEVGNYEVCLTVTDICGFTQRCETVAATCPLPNPAFDVTTTGLSIQLTALGDNANSYNWTLGDGSIADSTFVEYTYAEEGSYQVCLEVENECATLNNCQQIELTCEAPQASFSVDASGNLSVTAQALDTTANAYLWTFGDGNSADSTFVEYQYGATGEYQICLSVTDDCATVTECQQVSVNCLDPIAQFSYETVNSITQFSDSSSSDPNIWLWTFGDGASDTLANPQHQYAMNGVYTVCLTVSNICGSNTRCEPVNIIVNDVSEEGLSPSPYLYPNPAHDRIWLEGLGLENDAANIQLFHTNGAFIQQWSRQPSGHAVLLDIGFLPAGSYYVSVQQGGKKWVLPFIK